MAKRFFYVAAGVFLLVAAYQLGAQRAMADWGGTGLVAGIGHGVVWNALGDAYTPDLYVWNRQPPLDLPVPASDVRLIDGDGGSLLLVTTSDAVFWYTNSQWYAMPAVPGGPISVEGRSFGKTKGAYR